MADTSTEAKLEAGSKEPPTTSVETGAWKPGASPAADGAVKAVPHQFPQDVQIGPVTPESKVVAQADRTQPPAPTAPPLEPGLPKNFDAKAVAADLNDALHPAFFSWRSGPDNDRVWKALMNMSPQEFKAVNDEFNKSFAPADKPWLSGSKPWTLADDINTQLSGDRDRFDRLMESKQHNDVPTEHRVNGEQLLKPGSELKVGEINPVKLPDGRQYDVYIPKNADDRAPVIVAMHGAAGGDSVGLMATESGLTADAERTGSIVVFAYPEKGKFDTPFGKTDGVAWNAPGRTNLPTHPGTADDYKYMDNVLSSLASKSKTSEQVGMFGFSDGGRFAQVYAADHPEKVAAVVSEDGTWMKNDKLPQVGKPIMIVHGDRDKTLNYDGGPGWVGSVMNSLLGTNLDQSQPFRQAQVWKAADQCDGPEKATTNGDVTTHDFTGCKVGEVKEYILHDGHHALNDYKNDGNRFVQWLLGSPDRSQAFSTQGAEFLTKYIVSDPSMRRPS